MNTTFTITLGLSNAIMTISNIRESRNEIIYDVEMKDAATKGRKWKSCDCPYSSLVDLLANLQQGGWVFVNA